MVTRIKDEIRRGREREERCNGRTGEGGMGGGVVNGMA